MQIERIVLESKRTQNNKRTMEKQRELVRLELRYKMQIYGSYYINGETIWTHWLQTDRKFVIKSRVFERQKIAKKQIAKKQNREETVTV